MIENIKITQRRKRLNQNLEYLENNSKEIEDLYLSTVYRIPFMHDKIQESKDKSTGIYYRRKKQQQEKDDA